MDPGLPEKNRYETYAYFWVAADELPHKDISQKLEITPSDFWDKGDPTKTVMQRKQARWIYKSPLPLNEIFMDRHITAIIDVLSEKLPEVLALKSKYKIGISCVGYYWESHPGFHLSEELIAKCAALEISLDFDLYCLGRTSKENS